MNLTWASPAPTEELVTIGDTEYVLKEASAGAAAEHKDATFRAVKVNNQTNTSTFGGIADADLVLLSRSLFERRSPPNKPETQLLVPVPINTLKGWANRVIEPLVEHLKLVSGMQQPEDIKSLYKQREVINAKIAKIEGNPEDTDPNPQTSPSGTTAS